MHIQLFRKRTGRTIPRKEFLGFFPIEKKTGK
jgi:hypothetical protein